MMTTDAPCLDADRIAAALMRTSAPFRRAAEIDLTLARFESLYDQGEDVWRFCKYGRVVTTSLGAWLDERKISASQPFPVDGEKGSLPAEIGALLADPEGRGPRRRNRDVLGFTWIFVDCDSGASPNPLCQELDRLQIAYVVTESATSMYDGRPGKWHLFLPLTVPKTLPSRSLPDIDGPATLRATASWWRRVHSHVARCMLILGKIEDVDDESADDSSVRDLARVAYVPHSPDGRRRVIRGLPSGGGRTLDLDAFLRATGFDDVEPPIVRAEARPDGNPAPSQQHLDADDEDGGQDDGGATVGETTGTLVVRALDYFGMIGPRHDENSFEALCPWRENHTHDGLDPDRFDDSVLAYARGAGGSETGGFKCMHHGSGRPGECSRAGAGDVLRWARKSGCTTLPDRPEYGGRQRGAAETSGDQPQDDQTQGSTPADEQAPTRDAAPARVREALPEFPGAPKAGESAPRPTSSWEPAPRPSSRVAIEVSDQIALMRDHAIRAIAHHPSFFKQEGRLFDLVEPESELDKNGYSSRPWLRKTVASHLKAELTLTPRSAPCSQRGSTRPCAN